MITKKISLSLFAAITLGSIPCHGMQQYYDWILKQEKERTAYLISSKNPDVYGGSLTISELHAELERQTRNRIILNYLVAPVVTAIGIGAFIAKLTHK
jgi:hypothetical protein